MTFAAIHECKRIEVYSKQVNQPTYKTYIDLDQIQKNNLTTIPVPVLEDVPLK